MTDLTTCEPVNGLDLPALVALVEDIRADPGKAKAAFRVTTRWAGQTSSETIVGSCQIGGSPVDRSFTILADEPRELMGQDSAPNPQELLMAALNACLVVGYVANASVIGIDLTELEIETWGELDLRGYLGMDDAVVSGYQQLDYVVRIAGAGTAEQFESIHQVVKRTSPNFFNLNQPIRLNGRLEIG